MILYPVLRIFRNLARILALYYDVMMKYFVLCALLYPMVLVAHTSDQRYQDGVIIDLSTAPVAPWVGEKVGMSFVFRDAMTGLASTTIVSASVYIDALMREGNKIQEVVYESPVMQVEQGGFVMEHVFQEVGTYDMHVQFEDRDGVVRETGFRKQVRQGEATDVAALPYVFFGTAIMMMLVGWVLGRQSRVAH